MAQILTISQYSQAHRSINCSINRNGSRRGSLPLAGLQRLVSRTTQQHFCFILDLDYNLYHYKKENSIVAVLSAVLYNEVCKRNLLMPQNL